MSMWIPSDFDTLCEKLKLGKDIGSADCPVIVNIVEKDRCLVIAEAFGYELHARDTDDGLWAYLAFIKPVKAVVKPHLRLVK